MGEFSAGKSTLTNLFLGQRPLPEKVTATRLAPVWIAKGQKAPFRERLDGEHEQISLHNLDDVPVEDTRTIRMFFEADVLELCDIIDFPGISDPNMDAEVWQRVVEEVDVVLWCTHATQAWRQSESAAWATIPPEVQARSFLLVTRFDKLATDRDRNRVMARIRHETKGKFAEVFPMQLLKALNAGDDIEAWEDSGAAALLTQLGKSLSDYANGSPASAPSPVEGAENVTTLQPRPAEANISDIAPTKAEPEGKIAIRRVVPRRISSRGMATAPKPRPDRPEHGYDAG